MFLETQWILEFSRLSLLVFILPRKFALLTEVRVTWMVTIRNTYVYSLQKIVWHLKDTCITWSQNAWILELAVKELSLEAARLTVVGVFSRMVEAAPLQGWRVLGRASPASASPLLGWHRHLCTVMHCTVRLLVLKVSSFGSGIYFFNYSVLVWH